MAAKFFHGNFSALCGLTAGKQQYLSREILSRSRWANGYGARRCYNSLACSQIHQLEEAALLQSLFSEVFLGKNSQFIFKQSRGKGSAICPDCARFAGKRVEETAQSGQIALPLPTGSSSIQVSKATLQKPC